MSETVYLSIGSNLEDPVGKCKDAVERLKKLPMCEVTKVSSLYETEPWGAVDLSTGKQDNYINLAVEMTTSLSADKLLVILKGLETQMGREDNGKWQPRVIDFDIIFYGDRVIESPRLTVPHPHMEERKFVLEPLNEIAPDALHPLTGLTVVEMVSELNDDSYCKKISE